MHPAKRRSNEDLGKSGVEFAVSVTRIPKPQWPDLRPGFWGNTPGRVWESKFWMDHDDLGLNGLTQLFLKDQAVLTHSQRHRLFELPGKPQPVLCWPPCNHIVLTMLSEAQGRWPQGLAFKGEGLQLVYLSGWQCLILFQAWVPWASLLRLYLYWDPSLDPWSLSLPLTLASLCAKTFTASVRVFSL